MSFFTSYRLFLGVSFFCLFASQIHAGSLRIKTISGENLLVWLDKSKVGEETLFFKECRIKIYSEPLDCEVLTDPSEEETTGKTLRKDFEFKMAQKLGIVLDTEKNERLKDVVAIRTQNLVDYAKDLPEIVLQEDAEYQEALKNIQYYDNHLKELLSRLEEDHHEEIFLGVSHDGVAELITKSLVISRHRFFKRVIVYQSIKDPTFQRAAVGRGFTPEFRDRAIVVAAKVWEHNKAFRKMEDRSFEKDELYTDGVTEERLEEILLSLYGFEQKVEVPSWYRNPASEEWTFFQRVLKKQVAE